VERRGEAAGGVQCKEGTGLLPIVHRTKVNATAANLIERVLPPQGGLRQWVTSRSRGGGAWRTTEHCS
jgi:hypothetical protein